MENKNQATTINNYDWNNKPFEDIISEITEDIQKIKEPESEGKILLEMFKSKYNIENDIFANTDFYKTMRKTLKLQNNGLELPLCSRPDKAIQDWLAGRNPFSQSSSGYSPKQKIVAWMLYMKFSKDEVNDFLNQYDYGEMYVFDWIELCALTTYKFNESFEFFWNLQNRKKELFDKASRIMLIQEGTPTPNAKIDFDKITSIEGNEKSLVWFINKHKHEFGRTHLSVYLWIDEFLKISDFKNTRQRKIMFAEYDEKNIKELIGADESYIQEIGREYIRKYSTSVFGTEKYERKKESCQEAICNLCSRYDISDRDIIDKFYDLINKGLYEEFEKKLGNYVLLQIISRELNATIFEELSTALIKLRQSIPDFDIKEDQVGKMLDRTKNVSRTFVIKNILYHTSTDFIEEHLLHRITRDRFNKRNSTISNENIANMIESSINEILEDFGFRSLNPEYRADTLLLIAIHNVDYRSVLFQEDGDEQPYPFRRFVIGNSQDQYGAVKIEMRV